MLDLVDRESSRICSTLCLNFIPFPTWQIIVAGGFGGVGDVATSKCDHLDAVEALGYPPSASQRWGSN